MTVPPVPLHFHLTANLNFAANKRTCCADACLTDCQGNTMLFGLPVDIKVMPRRLPQVMRCFVHSRRSTAARTSAPPQRTFGSRCDRNKDYCHLGVRCTHTKPRSSLSAKMCHRCWLTARRMLLHARVFYTDCESIAIFQWQLQDVFEEQKNNLCSVESSRAVTARWKVSGGLAAFLVFILQNHKFSVKTPFSLDSTILIVTLSYLSEHTLIQNQQFKIVSSQWNHTQQIHDVLRIQWQCGNDL